MRVMALQIAQRMVVAPGGSCKGVRQQEQSTSIIVFSEKDLKKTRFFSDREKVKWIEGMMTRFGRLYGLMDGGQLSDCKRGQQWGELFGRRDEDERKLLGFCHLMQNLHL